MIADLTAIAEMNRGIAQEATESREWIEGERHSKRRVERRSSHRPGELLQVRH